MFLWSLGGAQNLDQITQTNDKLRLVDNIFFKEDLPTQGSSNIWERIGEA